MSRHAFPSRREFLFSSAAALSAGRLCGAGQDPKPAAGAAGLLDEIERRACLYFYEQADPEIGLVRDRTRMEGRDARRTASIAATGFGLSALCIATSRGYLDSAAARGRVRRTLEYLAGKAQHRRGFFLHFLDASTGERVWGSEYSSVDTAWLLCGALHCAAFWDDPGIRRAAQDLLDRVDWRWMLDGGDTLSHGWIPEGGFLAWRWDCYAELLAMYLLAAASRTSPIPASCWNAWKRPLRVYGDVQYIDPDLPLFVHQYSHAWFDFRGRRDGHADYFRNSQIATAAHRQFCAGLAGRFPWFGPAMWGITASDSRGGYVAWCSPENPPDGTLVPCAAGGSVAFLTEESTATLKAMFDRYGAKAWGRYGFVDAFHPEAGWYSPDVIGINQGITLLMIENSRSGAVWEAFMSTAEARRGMDAVGLLPAARA